MNYRFRIPFVFFAIFTILLLHVSQTHSAEPIAKVSNFKGEVTIQSDSKLTSVTQIGQVINVGDRIQTKEGELQITFNDGAILKIMPFTNSVIQEREEETGWFVFKTKKAVRRITVFVGKLWLKSGSSKTKNYLQTPTAVAGVRGSEIEAGYNNVMSLINVVEGLIDKTGAWQEGTFGNPGANIAKDNPVYKRVEAAKEKLIEATKSGKPVDQAKAQAEALKVIKEAATELKKNEDPKVKQEAEIVDHVADATVAAAEAMVVEEEVKETKEEAEKALQQAKDTGDVEAAKKAEDAVKQAEKTVQSIENAVKETQKAADEARELGEAETKNLTENKKVDLTKLEETSKKATEAKEV